MHLGTEAGRCVSVSLGHNFAGIYKKYIVNDLEVHPNFVGHVHSTILHENCSFRKG